MEMISMAGRPIAHGLYYKGALPCARCPYKELCEFYSPEGECKYELEAVKEIDNISKAEEVVLLLTGQEIARLITRLRLSIKYGKNPNFDIQNRVLGHAIAFLKLLGRFRAGRGEIIGKSLAQQLAELKREAK